MGVQWFSAGGPERREESATQARGGVHAARGTFYIVPPPTKQVFRTAGIRHVRGSTITVLVGRKRTHAHGDFPLNSGRFFPASLANWEIDFPDRRQVQESHALSVADAQGPQFSNASLFYW